MAIFHYHHDGVPEQRFLVGNVFPALGNRDTTCNILQPICDSVSNKDLHCRIRLRSNVFSSYLDMVSSLMRLNRPCISLNHSLFLVFLGFKLQTSCYSG